MITSQTDDPRMFPLVLVRGPVVQNLSVALFHLLECVRSVEGRDGDVSAVDLVSH